jgi:formate hydrogenlyase subunit 6/NADH:ubiquinone oxidoreductase subunit I
MVKGVPYPTKLFDLNFSPVSLGYVVAARTDKGGQLIKENQSYFTRAKESQLTEKNEGREGVVSQLLAQNKAYECNCSIDWTEAHKKNLENPVWRTLTKDCVECSACNLACPSCTCFVLLDQQGESGREKQKGWDACLKAGYARTAGGGNSRPKLFERLQNRYHCKFDYSFDRLGRYTCVGCGRCINACAGNIDMRQIYAELVKQVPLSARLA